MTLSLHSLRLTVALAPAPVPGEGVEPDWGKASLAFLAGEGAGYQSGEKAKKARLIRLRRQIAWALSDMAA